MVVDLQLKSEAFSRDLEKVKGQVRRGKKDFDDMGDSVGRALGRFITVGAAVQAVRYLGKEIMEAEAASAKLEGVLRATGNAAGVTSRQISEMATSLHRSTGVDDDLIKDASAALATFGNISGDTFTRTIGLALDLSAVFGGDLSSNVTKLGKALSDPAEGLDALSKMGIKFNKAQKDVIADLVKQNKLLEAQAKVLEAVEGRVGGTAEQMGQAGLTGVLNTLIVPWRELIDSVGKSEDDFNRAKRGAEGLAGAMRWLRDQTLIDSDPDSLAGVEARIRAIDKALKRTARSDGVIPDDAYTRRLKQERLNLEGQLAGINMLEYGKQQMAKGDAARAAAEAQRDRAQTDADKRAEERLKDLAQMRDDQAARALDAANHLASEEARLYEEQTRAAIEAIEDQEKAEDKAFEKFMDHMEDIRKEEERLAEDRAKEEYARSWGRAFENIQDHAADTFADLLEGDIRTFKDFASAILNIWKRTLAEMAAAQLTSGLSGLIGRALSGGFGSAFSGAAGFVDSPLPGAGGAGTVGATAMGNVFNVSIHAIDSRSFAETLQQHPGTVGGMVVQLARSNRDFANAIGAPA